VIREVTGLFRRLGTIKSQEGGFPECGLKCFREVDLSQLKELQNQNQEMRRVLPAFAFRVMSWGLRHSYPTEAYLKKEKKNPDLKGQGGSELSSAGRTSGASVFRRRKWEKGPSDQVVKSNKRQVFSRESDRRKTHGLPDHYRGGDRFFRKAGTSGAVACTTKGEL